jgi:hypothetical protein
MNVKAVKDNMGNTSMTKHTRYLFPTWEMVLVYPSNSPKRFEVWNVFLGTSVIGSIWLPKRIRYTS